MKNTIIALTLALVITMGTTAAMAGGPGYGWGRGYNSQGPAYGTAAIPNMTPEQSTKIQALQKAHLDAMAPLQQDLLKKKMELRSLWLTQTPDQAKITALQKGILSLESTLREKGTNFNFEVRKVLTPEQQAQMASFGPGMGWGKGRMGRMARW
jgi:Spy/CpxP family protein refolding chaperone